MTNAEMIEKARRIKLWSTPAVEHVLLLHNVADALEEADKEIQQAVDLAIALNARIKGALTDLEDLCSMITHYERSDIRELHDAVHVIRAKLEKQS